MSKKYWLLKSEPETYSIDSLQKDGKTIWSGVRNYQARNLMRDQMSVEDECFFYHSSCEVPAIVGLGIVTRIGVVDDLQFDKKSEYYDPKSRQESPTWICVEIRFLRKFKIPLPLSDIKKTEILNKMLLVKPGSRLSVQPVGIQESQYILKHLSIL